MWRGEIKQITAQEAIPVRQSVLRPGQPVSEVTYAGDDMAEAGHFGAYSENDLLGVASVFPNDLLLPDGWQLRGMAVLPEYQGKGLGSVLLEACVEYVKAKHGSYLWCNVRVTAQRLYQRQGFQQDIAAGVYDIPGAGPHVRYIYRMSDEKS